MSSSGDPYQPVNPGSSVRPSARAENAKSAAAKKHANTKFGREGGGYGGNGFTASIRFNVRAAIVLTEFYAVALSHPMDVTPVNEPFDALDAPTFPAVAPDVNYPFAILDGPLGIGDVGTAVVAGFAVCKVNIVDANHIRADVVNGTYANLISTAGGRARIVYKESGTGLKWAGIMIGEARPLVRGVTSGSTAAGAYGTVVVASESFTVFNPWSQSIGTGKKCMFGWNEATAGFEFIAVDC